MACSSCGKRNKMNATARQVRMQAPTGKVVQSQVKPATSTSMNSVKRTTV